MRRLFSRSSDVEIQEAPSLASIAWQKLKEVGPFPIGFCLVSFAGLLLGALTGTAMVPGKEPHMIAFAESPIWFSVAMIVNGVVTLFSAGYIWFRILGK